MLLPRAVRFVLCGCCLSAATMQVSALPHPDEEIDPNKRAPISTADAVKPGATPIKGDGVVNARIIRMNEIPVRRASVEGERANVDVKESREKNVTKPTARKLETREVDVRRAADLPTSLPRLAPGSFQRMLSDYEAGRDPADTGLATDVVIDGKRVSLADINRFASPRAALEAQGIPVTSAGEDEVPPNESAPVPFSAEKNGGAGATPRR